MYYIVFHNGIIRNFAPPNGNILHKTNLGLRIKALYLHIESESTTFIQYCYGYRAS